MAIKLIFIACLQIVYKFEGSPARATFPLFTFRNSTLNLPSMTTLWVSQFKAGKKKSGQRRREGAASRTSEASEARCPLPPPLAGFFLSSFELR